MTVELHDFNEPYDASDVKALRKYLASGLSYQQIADLMGRTYAGAKSKAYRLRRDGLL